MQIISGTTDFLLQGASAVAIGKFDGMHRGHKALLSEILEAKKRGLQAVVFTFDPPPAVLFSGKAVKGLTTREEKRRLFRQIGIDVLIEFPLTFQTAAISPEDFLRVIVQEQIGAKLVALCGDGNGCARQTVRAYIGISYRQPDASCRQAFAAKRRVPLGGGMQQWCF